jgi:hypothetical protein
VIADEFLVSTTLDAFAIGLSLNSAGPFPVADMKRRLTVITVWPNAELCAEIRKADLPLDRIGGTGCRFPMPDGGGDN